jgi:hypothetical protein
MTFAEAVMIKTDIPASTVAAINQTGRGGGLITEYNPYQE